MLYLQSAVVMMDCLTVLSIISHTHKHNNNAVNINNKMFGLHMLHDNSSLDTVDIEQTWEMLQHCAPPEKPMCKPKSQIPVLGVASAGTKSHILGLAQARVPWEWEWSGSRVALAGHELGDVGLV